MIAARKFYAPLLASALLIGGTDWGSLSAAEEAPTGAPPSDVEADAPPPPSGAKLEGLVTVLGAEDYETRMAAQSELLELSAQHGGAVAEALVGPYLTASDPDLRARLRLTIWNAKRLEVQTRPVGFVGIQMLDSFLQLGNGANAGFQRTVQVVRVIEGTAAEKNGLRLGDQIVGVDGKDFNEGESPSILFKEHVSSRTVGDAVDLKIMRGPQELTVKVQLGKRPPMDLLGLPNDEKDVLETTFNAFLREAAEKRGLALPKSELPSELLQEAPEGDDPFAP